MVFKCSYDYEVCHLEMYRLFVSAGEIIDDNVMCNSRKKEEDEVNPSICAGYVKVSWF